MYRLALPCRVVFVTVFKLRRATQIFFLLSGDIGQGFYSKLGQGTLAAQLLCNHKREPQEDQTTLLAS